MRNHKKYRILFVEGGLGSGGSSNYLWYFLKCLNMEKFIPTVLFYNMSKGPDIERIKELGIEVLFLNNNAEIGGGVKDSARDTGGAAFVKGAPYVRMTKKILKKLRILPLIKFSRDLLLSHIPNTVRMERLLKRKSFNLVFLNNDLHYHIPAVLAAGWFKTPCICRKAGIGGGRYVKKILHPMVRLFIASSNGAKQDYLLEGLSEEKIVLIYEGIDFSRFAETAEPKAVRQELNIPEDVVVVGSIARIAPGKGQFELVDAIPSVVEKCPGIRFVIVGDDVEHNGKLLHDLRSKAKHLGIPGYCVFTGWRTDIPNLLGAMDIFVHNPSDWLEALGIATLEAMAMGKPTIVTDNWGLAETTEDGVTGYIIPSRNKEALCSAIINLALDSDKRKGMGENARKRAESLFDISGNVKVTEKIILGVIEKKDVAVMKQEICAMLPDRYQDARPGK